MRTMGQRPALLKFETKPVNRSCMDIVVASLLQWLRPTKERCKQRPIFDTKFQSYLQYHTVRVAQSGTGPASKFPECSTGTS